VRRGTDGAAFVVAAAQAAPVFLDLRGSVDRACELIAAAGREGARLVVFPEAFLPGYPDWVWLVPAREKATLEEMYAGLLSNAVVVPGPATVQMGRAARRAGVAVAMGISERNDERSGTTLYNTLLYIGADGEILGRHRKLVPTGGERLVWAQGEGDTLGTVSIGAARVGGLICWENYMPLARFALYAAGIELYLAPTWDHGEPWVSTLRHIAKEGRTYVVGCCTAMRMSEIPDRFAFKALYPAGKEWVNPGGTAIADPDGRLIAGPLLEHQDLVVAAVDLGRLRGSRWILDVAGHYARPDVFQLSVKRQERPLVFAKPPAAMEIAGAAKPAGAARAAGQRGRQTRKAVSAGTARAGSTTRRDRRSRRKGTAPT
jgi:nitrilase